MSDKRRERTGLREGDRERGEERTGLRERERERESGKREQG